MSETLYALSSGRVPAGVAVIRVSGPAARDAVKALTGSVPPSRRASLRTFRHPATGEAIDRGLVLLFEAGSSFTGEETAEFQVHGGPAVVAAMLDALASMPGLRAAEAGAFTRRAFENGRLDLTAVEGLADLIAAETEAQRRQALRVADGHLARRADGWRSGILALRAAVEADLDFADEDDVPEAVAEGVVAAIAALRADMLEVLADGWRGERVRDGFEVAIMGEPNAGKSSLLNALAKRDVAIVTEVPGTTRDVLEVHLDLGGYPVTILDTAGLRESVDRVEAEGIRRARRRGEAADLVLWLDPGGSPPPDDLRRAGPLVVMRSKADEGQPAEARGASSRFPAAVSVVSGEGLAELVEALGAEVAGTLAGEPSLLVRARQRECLSDAAEALDVGADIPMEIVADRLRMAGDAIGRLTGRIDVEDVLGAIFQTFCIGK